MRHGKRLVLNSAANWGRGLIALFLGLFSCRWALQTFGVEGYGLWTLCCSASTIAFSLHTMISAATQRFLSVAVGESETKGADVLSSWRKVSARTHITVAVLTLALFMPLLVGWLGAISGVPEELTGECRMVVLALFVQGFAMMVNTPNRQLFVAHQSMVEPAVWGTLGVALNFSVLCWMVHHPGEWLVRYVFLMAVANVAIEVCMGVRVRYLFSHAFKTGAVTTDTAGAKSKAGRLVRFAGWRMVADGGNILGAHGFNILVSRMLGSSFAGGVGIARSMTNHANALAGSIGTAFEPAMANDAGRSSGIGQRLVYRACIWQTGAYLLCAVPIWLFADTILGVWLKTPPPGCVTAVRWLLAAAVAGAFGCSFFNAVSATGQVKKLYIGVGVAHLLALPLGVAITKMVAGFDGLSGLCCGFFISQAIVAVWDWHCFNEVSAMQGAGSPE